MNIYANKGYKVIVTNESAKNGHNKNIKDVEDYLEIGKIYTVEKNSNI
jgi:hypothetical protein